MVDNLKLRKLDFEKLYNFYIVFREGSVSKAAELIGKPSYTFYYELKTLEDLLGTKLYIGGKKNFVLTEDGKKLADFCKVTLDNLNLIIDNKEEFVTRDLVIHTTVTLGLYFFPVILQQFKQKYPDVKIKLLSGPEYIGSRFHDFDVLVANYMDNRADLSQNMLKDFSYGYFASKDYLERHGEPKTEDDLKNHDFLVYSGQHFIPEQITRNVKTVLESNSYASLFEMCFNGFGICSLSLDIYEILLKDNLQKFSNLVRILPDVVSEQDSVYFSFFKFTAKEKPIRELFEITKRIMKKEEL